MVVGQGASRRFDQAARSPEPVPVSVHGQMSDQYVGADKEEEIVSWSLEGVLRHLGRCVGGGVDWKFSGIPPLLTKSIRLFSQFQARHGFGDGKLQSFQPDDLSPASGAGVRCALRENCRGLRIV